MADSGGAQHLPLYCSSLAPSSVHSCGSLLFSVSQTLKPPQWIYSLCPRLTSSLSFLLTNRILFFLLNMFFSFFFLSLPHHQGRTGGELVFSFGKKSNCCGCNKCHHYDHCSIKTYFDDNLFFKDHKVLTFWQECK